MRKHGAGRDGNLLVGRGGLGGEARSDDGLQKRHHGAQAGAELLDGILLFGFALGEEIDAAIFVFLNPFLGETSVFDFGEELLHGFAGFVSDDARACGVVAVFGGVADGIAHVAEAATVDEIDDELQFVETFEVSDFGLIAGFGEGFESSFDERADAAAEDGLFAEEIGFRFFGESGFENSGAGATDTARVAQCESFGFAAGVLLDREEAWCAAAFGEDFSYAMAGSLWRDHGDVDGGWRLGGGG